MMSKFLLFLCFTAVHVLGEGEKNIASKTDVPLVHTTSLQHNPKQPLETLSKVVSSVEPASTDKIETKSKPEENLTTQSFTIAPLRSTAVTPNVTNISTTSESSVEQSHVPVISEVKHAALRTTIASYDSSGKWIVNGTDKVCIIVQMAVDFNIAYTDDKNQTFHKKFDIPEDNATRATGFCGVGEQNLTLEWSSINITNASLTLHFVKNETIEDYFFHHLEIVLPAVNFGNSTLNKTKILVYEAKPNYAVGLGQSYRCMKQQKFNLKNQETSNQTSSYLIVSDLQFQAFRADKTTVFGLPKDCAFDTPDIVPIAVGCGLAALVIVVLVAYLYGRRRSQAQGYLSM